MDPNRHEDLGEMYSPDDQGEYTSLDEAPCFSLQGLSDALADTGEGTWETSAEEYTMMEVTPSSRILLECSDGHACTQEQSGSSGAGTCASRWP